MSKVVGNIEVVLLFFLVGQHLTTPPCHSKKSLLLHLLTVLINNITPSAQYLQKWDQSHVTDSRL